MKNLAVMQKCDFVPKPSASMDDSLPPKEK